MSNSNALKKTCGLFSFSALPFMRAGSIQMVFLVCVIPRESEMNSYGGSCDIGAHEKITLKESFILKWSV